MDEQREEQKKEEPEKYGLFNLGCLAVVIVFVILFIKIFSVIVTSIVGVLPKNLQTANKNLQTAKKQRKETLAATEQWVKTNMADAELVGEADDYCFTDLDGIGLSCKAVEGTMRHNGREFHYVFEPVSSRMFSDEYGDTFDKEFGEWLHGQLFYDPKDGQSLQYSVREQDYRYKVADDYECRRTSLTMHRPLLVKSMHPANMKENQIGDWIRNNLSKSYAVTEKLTLTECEDLWEIALITDESNADGAGVSLRVLEQLCDGSVIELYNEDDTKYVRFYTKGTSVIVSYWLWDWTHVPERTGWYKQKEETYQIEQSTEQEWNVPEGGSNGRTEE